MHYRTLGFTSFEQPQCLRNFHDNEKMEGLSHTCAKNDRATGTYYGCLKKGEQKECPAVQMLLFDMSGCRQRAYDSDSEVGVLRHGYVVGVSSRVREPGLLHLFSIANMTFDIN